MTTVPKETPEPLVIPLSRGHVALADQADAELLSRFTWYATRTRHTTYAEGYEPGAQRKVSMHRVIMGLQHGDPPVDHIDGDGLNNQRSNLRQATVGLNNAHGLRRKRAACGFKGVKPGARGRWQAGIRRGSRTIYLGSYDTQTEAALAYDVAALAVFGDFAVLNFPAIAERARTEGRR